MLLSTSTAGKFALVMERDYSRRGDLGSLSLTVDDLVRLDSQLRGLLQDPMAETHVNIELPTHGVKFDNIDEIRNAAELPAALHDLDYVLRTQYPKPWREVRFYFGRFSRWSVSTKEEYFAAAVEGIVNGFAKQHRVRRWWIWRILKSHVLGILVGAGTAAAFIYLSVLAFRGQAPSYVTALSVVSWGVLIALNSASRFGPRPFTLVIRREPTVVNRYKDEIGIITGLLAALGALGATVMAVVEFVHHTTP
jgi:hypothetical protein